MIILIKNLLKRFILSAFILYGYNLFAMNNMYLIALLLSTFAGLSTLIGGFVTFFIKRNSLKFLLVIIKEETLLNHNYLLNNTS